jgi:murein DD-endopeptidase MepM/ murein hydrolase activator NlpD
MISKTLHTVVSMLLVLLAARSAPVSAGNEFTARALSVPLASEFSLPLGYRDGVSYGPRITYKNGKLTEDSEYGVKNPDMQGGTCFGLDWGQLYHAGEDWYREDGKSTSGAEVTAVADGNVKYISYDFPGAVMIIRHRLPPDGQQKIFSLYGHLDPNSITVSVGQVVQRGQKLGTVLLQYYDGRYTGYHDDSHLHFEMRGFYDGSNIYPDYPYCNGYIPGRGYTYPPHPDVFPSESIHYTDPIAYIQRLPVAFLPLIIRPPLFELGPGIP